MRVTNDGEGIVLSLPLVVLSDSCIRSFSESSVSAVAVGVVKCRRGNQVRVVSLQWWWVWSSGGGVIRLVPCLHGWWVWSSGGGGDQVRVVSAVVVGVVKWRWGNQVSAVFAGVVGVVKWGWG
jgi:hypothetical protein